jgi:hypothetical protein
VLVGLAAGSLGLSARREARRLERAVTEAGAPEATEAGAAEATPKRPRQRRFLRRGPKRHAAAPERRRTGKTGRGE